MQSYKKSKIYKLVSNETDDIYVGSTVQSLYKRKHSHKSSYKRWMGAKPVYMTSYELVKYDDCDIILLEECNCDNKIQLHARERYWIEKLNCVNKIVPTRTRKEYNNCNREKISKERKEWYVLNKVKVCQNTLKYYYDNREKIREKRRRKMVCECGSTIRIADKSRHFRSMKHQQFSNNQAIEDSSESEESSASE